MGDTQRLIPLRSGNRTARRYSRAAAVPTGLCMYTAWPAFSADRTLPEDFGSPEIVAGPLPHLGLPHALPAHAPPQAHAGGRTQARRAGAARSAARSTSGRGCLGWPGFRRRCEGRWRWGTQATLGWGDLWPPENKESQSCVRDWLTH